MRLDEKISIQQLTILVVFCTIGDSILILPTLTARASLQDAWISSIVGILFGLALVLLMMAVSRTFPDKSVIQFNRSALGGVAGNALSVLFLIYFLLNTSAMIREIGDFITTKILPDTPLRAVHMMMLIVLFIGVRIGLEPLARASEIFFPWFLLFFFSLVLLLVPQIDGNNLLPIFAEGAGPILHGALYSAVYPFNELIVFMMILPSVRQDRHMRRDFLLGALMGGVSLLILVTLSILVLGPYMTSSNAFPAYALAKKISIAHFLERVEAMQAVIWLFSTFFKSVLYFYAFSIGSAQLFKLRDYRLLVYPFTMIIFGLALYISPNVTYYSEMTSKYWPFWDLSYMLILPIAPIVFWMRRKRRRPAPATQS